MSEDTKGVSKSPKTKKTGNTKVKRTKGQSMIYKTLHRKLQIKQHNLTPLKSGRELNGSGRVGSSGSTGATRCVFIMLQTQ